MSLCLWGLWVCFCLCEILFIFVFVRFLSIICVSMWVCDSGCDHYIDNWWFWLVLLVDVDLDLPKHVKYYYLVWVYYVIFRFNTLPLAANSNKATLCNRIEIFNCWTRMPMILPLVGESFDYTISPKMIFNWFSRFQRHFVMASMYLVLIN